jgi:hypothetical protein
MARVSASGQTGTVVAEAAEGRSYVDWGAVIAGAALATAIGFILLAFGAALGLSFASPYRGVQESSLWLYAIGAAIWLIWVQASAYMAGGYLAGRMRKRHFDATPTEVEVRDGAHGLTVWAVGVLISAAVAGMVGTGAIQLAGGAAQTAATAASGNADAADGRTGYFVDMLLRPASPASAGAGTTPPGATATSPATTATTSTTASPGTGAPRDPAAADASRREISRILTVGAGRDMAADDRTYIARVVAERTGLSQAEAERRVDETVAKAKDAANKARKAAIITAFITVTALLIGAAAAWWAGSMGGRDRDRGTAFSLFGRWGY